MLSLAPRFSAIVYDARDNAALVSLRHQDAVVKLDLATGRVKWILGPHDGWQAPWRTLLLTPRGALTWQYHQHAPMLTPNGTILLFDNGNYRARPFAEELKASDSYSRAVEYAVDERTRTVAQVWTYGGPADERFYSSFIGGADWLPRTGNVLVTDGGRISNSGGDPSDQGLPLPGPEVEGAVPREHVRCRGAGACGGRRGLSKQGPCRRAVIGGAMVLEGEARTGFFRRAGR